MKQTLFYMISCNEEQALVDFLRKESDVKIACYKTFTPELDIRDTVPPLENNFTYFLWNTAHSPPPSNLYIPTQKYYIIDEWDLNSEVIIFNRCIIHKDKHEWINIGRIAIHHKLWVGGMFVERPKYFIDFFERARQWIRKNACYTKKGKYVFPSADRFFEEGGMTGPY